MISGISSASQLSSKLFTALDTKSQGYLEKSDFVSAFSKISSDSDSSSTSVDDIFSALDSDSDGKVTKSEFADTLAKLEEQLNSQFNQSRMQGAGGRPPPPPADDAGFTKDELSSQLEEISSTDSKRSSLISNIVNNFAAADTNSDGKVSFSEAQTYDKSSQSTQSTSSSSTTASTASSNSDAQLMMKIMQLMHAYSDSSNSQTSSTSSLLSVSA